MIFSFQSLESVELNQKNCTFIPSYLKNGKQLVDINRHKSTPKIVPHGVPQGSVLDPLLFTVFTNDLRKAVVEFVVDIYADPTTNKCIGCLKMGTK